MEPEEKLDRLKLEEKDEKKPFIGRPKGSKDSAKRVKKVNLKDFDTHPIANIANNITMNLINGMVLNDKQKKLTEDDMKEIQFGQALTYTIEYYLKSSSNHPLMLLGGASAGVALKTISLKVTKEHIMEKKKDEVGMK
jgi:hypothetical protein